MKIEKSNRRIEIALRYGDPLQPKIKARKYKWDPTKRVWWKGYTDEEMAWAQEQAAGKQEAAARLAERRANAVKLAASYQQTEPVKDELTALGCFLESTGEREFSQRKGEYVFAKSWYAPTDKAERAKAIIQHGGAAKADAAAAKAAEAKARHEALIGRLRECLATHDLPIPSHIDLSWSVDVRFAWTPIRGKLVSGSFVKGHDGWSGAGWTESQVVLYDRTDDTFTVIGDRGTREAPVGYRVNEARAHAEMESRRTAEQLPAAQAEAARYGRTATNIRRNLQWRGAVGAKIGDVIHTKTLGWALVVAISSEAVGWRDIEDREDRDDFGGGQTPGVETNATVIPVAPTDAEQATHAEKLAAEAIRKEARYQRAANHDDFRTSESEAYRVALDNERRLDAGEKALDIIHK